MSISTCVRFTCSLRPPSSPKENPNPGIEIAQHLKRELPKYDIEVLGIEDIEYAHEIKCQVADRRYGVLVGYDWITENWWEVFYNPSLSWLQKIRGRSESEEMRKLTSALFASISSFPGIGELRWYDSYRVTPRESYSSAPEL